MSAGAARGALYLVPTPLDFACSSPEPSAPAGTAGPAASALEAALPLHTLQTAARLTHWISENAKSTRAFLGRVAALCPLALPLQAQQICELPRQVQKKGDHDPATAFDARPLLAAALAGHDMGLISEAGLPAVADPGACVVRAAHALGLPVRPLVGPVSLLLALAGSGLNGQNFAFVGYLPQDAAERSRRIRELEALAWQNGQTQIFIETPYRNAALLHSLLGSLKPDTRLAVCAGLTLAQQGLHSASVADWKRQPPRLPLELPAVFLLGR